MAAAYAALLTPEPFSRTTFANEEGYDELIVLRDIPFQSLCRHHMLPFHGVAHVGYLPDGQILGLSKLVRVVELFYSRGMDIRQVSLQPWARLGWINESHPAITAPPHRPIIRSSLAPIAVVAMMPATSGDLGAPVRAQSRLVTSSALVDPVAGGRRSCGTKPARWSFAKPAAGKR